MDAGGFFFDTTMYPIMQCLLADHRILNGANPILVFLPLDSCISGHLVHIYRIAPCKALPHLLPLHPLESHAPTSHYSTGGS
jgi:hypothetical protein